MGKVDMYKKIQRIYKNIVDEYSDGIENNEYNRIKLSNRLKKLIHTEYYDYRIVCDESNNFAEILNKDIIKVRVMYKYYYSNLEIKYVDMYFGKGIMTPEKLRELKLKRILNNE